MTYASEAKDTKKSGTGKKVNSAIDNPSSYYKRRTLQKQSNDSIAITQRKIRLNKDGLNPFAKIIKK